MKTEHLEKAKEIIQKNGESAGLPQKRIDEFVNRVEANEAGEVSMSDLMRLTIEMHYRARDLEEAKANMRAAQELKKRR